MLLKQEWGSKTFDIFQASRDPGIVAEDAARLTEIFNSEPFTTPGSMAMQALDWAQKNDVNFYIDHKRADNAIGYYVEGTGCVAISERWMDSHERLVNVIVHEIRHAWQDRHGMIATAVNDFGNAFIRLALLEADALAHGVYAAHGEGHERIPYMQKTFREWYHSLYPVTYGRNVLRSASTSLNGVDRPPDSTDMREVLPYFSTGMDVSHVNNVLPLGNMFDHTNYLAGQEMRDFLVTRCLSKTLARQFHKSVWGTSKDTKLAVIDLDKKLLRMKREQGGHVFFI